MLRLKMERADWPNGASVDSLEACLGSLAQPYVPLLATGRHAQAEALGISHELLRPSQGQRMFSYANDPTLYAEVIAASTDCVIIAELIGQANARGQTGGASHVSLSAVGTDDLDGHLRAVASKIQEDLGVELRPYRYVSDAFTRLRNEGLAPPDAPSPDELRGAGVLAGTAERQAALSIASSGGLLRGDVPKQVEQEHRENVDAIITSLADARIIESDLVVICRRNSTQVARVPDRTALEQATLNGIRCACGRALQDERIEDALSLSSLGRALLDGSRWMSILLMARIHELGIDYEYMLVEQKAGTDEMDCFVDVSGELSLFELKDKEFSLGNAYSFGAKIGIHRPEHSVVVTTSYVGNDAKEHFRRALDSSPEYEFEPRSRGKAVRYIEGLEHLEAGLADLMDQIFRQDVALALRRAMPFGATDASSFLTALEQRRTPSPITS